MSETTLWLYDLTAPQLAEAKVILRTLLRPTDEDTALLHIIDMPDKSRRYDLCLTLDQNLSESADVVAVLARSLNCPFECTNFSASGALWRHLEGLGLHHVGLDDFGSPVLSEPVLQEAIAASRGSGLTLAASIRLSLGSHYDDVLEGYRLRSGEAKTRSISLAS